MKLTAQVAVNLNTTRARQQADGFARALVLELARATQLAARENVAPGRGPGPHPHRSGHTDTGELRDNIEIKEVQQGFLKTALAYTDLLHGLYLELGWHTRAGTFYRYPWLKPALDKALEKGIEIAKAKGKLYFG